MWEIGKTRSGRREGVRPHGPVRASTPSRALKEIDRRPAASRRARASSRRSAARRSASVLCMGPFNYPLNETFTTLIPALVMGNTVVAKLPRYGALCQAPLLRCFAEAFPPGVVNIVNGDGRTVAGPLVESGAIAALAFIGSSRVANVLKKQHPQPQPPALHPRPRREEPRDRAGRRRPRPRRARVRDRRAVVQRPALHGDQARSTSSAPIAERFVAEARGRGRRAALRPAVGAGREAHAAAGGEQGRRPAGARRRRGRTGARAW